jgi:hypothetical protein
MVIVHVLGSEVGGDKRSIGARSERYCISAYLYVCRRAGYTQIGIAISYLAGPQERIHPSEDSRLAWWLSKGKASLRRPIVSVGEPASGSRTWPSLNSVRQQQASLQQHRDHVLSRLLSSSVLAAHPGSVQCSRRTRSRHRPTCLASPAAKPEHRPITTHEQRTSQLAHTHPTTPLHPPSGPSLLLPLPTQRHTASYLVPVK